MPTDRLYTGQRWDAALGLYDYRARWYDPALGRFVSADTVVPDPSAPQDLNRYAYVRNSPLNYRDPSGHLLDPGEGGDSNVPPPPPWYTPVVVAAAEAWSWYDSHVNETLRYYEVDRLWTQPPIQFGLRGDPISTEV